MKWWEGGLKLSTNGVREIVEMHVIYHKVRATSGVAHRQTRDGLYKNGTPTSRADASSCSVENGAHDAV
jgi:hypothetical protein